MVELVYNVFHIGFKKEKKEIRTESANLFLRFMFILDNLHFSCNFKYVISLFSFFICIRMCTQYIVHSRQFTRYNTRRDELGIEA